MPVRTTSFVASALVGTSAFVAGPGLPAPTDYAVAYAPDCGAVTVTVARDWRGEINPVYRLRAVNGQVFSAAATVGGEAALTFAGMSDGAYTLLVTSASGLLYSAPLLAACAAAKCLRELNRVLATAGRGGQALTPGSDWRNVYARLRLASAASATDDPATAQKLLDSLTPFCAPCGCGC